MGRNAFTTYLGVTLDRKVTWTPHINAVCCKQHRTGLYMIIRITCISNKTTSTIAYYVLFESHLRYRIAVWGGTTANNMQCTHTAKTSCQTLLKPTVQRILQKGFPRTADAYSGEPVHIGSSNPHPHQGLGHSKTWGTNTWLYHQECKQLPGLPVTPPLIGNELHRR